MVFARYFTILLLLTTSCKQTDIRFIEAASHSSLKKERLGESIYYIEFPPNMFVEESRGKEGQLGYGLWLLDSINRYTGPSGFIEIEHGRPHGWEPDCDRYIEKAYTKILERATKWKICKAETSKYFSAVAFHSNLILTARSPTKTGLDSMISIIATLSQVP